VGSAGTAWGIRPGRARPITGIGPVATKTIHGSFSVTAFSRTIANPSAIRLKSKATARGAVDWTVACSQGYSITSFGGTWKPYPGTSYKELRLGFSHPGSCIVVASLGLAGFNGGTITVSLQKH
jgi:hypothetical protein